MWRAGGRDDISHRHGAVAVPGIFFVLGRNARPPTVLEEKKRKRKRKKKKKKKRKKEKKKKEKEKRKRKRKKKTVVLN